MNESNRPEARILKGFRDIFGETLVLRRKMIDSILGVYERYGFSPLETPTLEYLDVLGKYLPESDTPEGGIFAFRDERREWVGLRYDLTAPLSRVVAQYSSLPLPYRRYQVGPVFRQEKPGAGRYREFHQCDFDTVGTASMLADAEVCCILADALEAVGICRGDYLVRVNNRKVLNGILEKACVKVTLAGDQPSDVWLKVSRAIDKLDRVGIEGVLELLGEGRKDQSGDFTPGAGLEPEQIECIHRYLCLPKNNRAIVCNELEALVKGSRVGEEGVQDLTEIHTFLSKISYDEKRVIFDPTVVRGLGYYTGPVFEAELTFEVAEEGGEKHQFGSVAGGGRYDDLVERFIGKVMPATGASIGVDRLLAAIQAVGISKKSAMPRSILVMVLSQDHLSEYFDIASEIRNAGIPAEVYLGSGGLKNQLKYADKRSLMAAVLSLSCTHRTGVKEVDRASARQQIVGDAGPLARGGGKGACEVAFLGL